MKFWHLLIIALFLSGCKNNIKENSKSENRKTEVIFHTTPHAFFYAGIDNPVNFELIGLEQSEVSYEIAPGVLFKTDSGYFVRVEDVAHARFMVLKKKSNDKYKLLFEKVFEIRNLPKPNVYIGNKSYGSITIKDLLDAKGITVKLKYNDFNVGYDVKYFTLSSYIKGEEVTIKSQSSKFTNEQNELIKKLMPGNKIYIDEIKVQQLPNWEHTEGIFYQLPP